MENEVWRDIEGYEGLYRVSNLGRVSSIKRTVSMRINDSTTKQTVNGRIMKPWITGYNSNYFCVSLCLSGKRKNNLVHRLVARAFIENKENKPQVDHIDGNQKNNNVKNLRWVSNHENSFHYKKTMPIKGYTKKVGATGARYLCTFVIYKKGYFLGSFSTPEESQAVYKEAYVSWYGVEPNLITPN